MSLRDKLKDSQGAVSRPKLNVKARIEMKEDPESKKPAFSFYHKEEKKYYYNTKPITGIYVGYAFKLSIFDDNLGKNGGQYMSDYYWTKKMIHLYDFNGHVLSGDMEAIDSFSNNCTGNTKKVLCIFILTDHGLYEVQTNLIIGLDQIRKGDDDIWLDYKMSLVPTLFNNESGNVSAKAIKFLGKFASKNPPKYAQIEQGDILTDEALEKSGVEKVIDEFAKWKEYKLSRTDKQAGEEDAQGPNEPDQKMSEEDVKEDAPGDLPPDEEPSDDLPF